MIRGATVTLWARTPTGEVDGFNRPIYTETAVQVENVLITPTAAEEIVNDLQLYGRRSEYELSLPKGDANNWNDARVTFWGRDWHTIGPAREWIEENVPLRWNRKVKVERYE
jgi:hypothetical protein